MKKTKQSRKGFTLIELLVVIAILAVLAVVVVLTLNPAGLLQEARDSNRVSDMASLKSALSLYLADVAPPVIGTSTDCYISMATDSFSVQGPATSSFSATSSCGGWFLQAPLVANVITSNPATTGRGITGGGWIPVNFTSISAGSPFPVLPVDPINNASYFYSYEANSSANVFKVNMFMESSKYQHLGGGDVTTNDGGNDPYSFEGGSNLSM